LASIRSPPPPPSDLTIIQEHTANPIVQCTTTNNEELIQVLPEESMSDDYHEPPGVLNSKQQDVYRICSEYLSYESRRRNNSLRAVDHSVAVPLLLIHGAPGTGKSFLVSHVVQRAHTLAIGTNACAYNNLYRICSYQS
jgi:SpoVK/Ycf46/Vps4 family AAA+-type ATPase